VPDVRLLELGSFAGQAEADVQGLVAALTGAFDTLDGDETMIPAEVTDLGFIADALDHLIGPVARLPVMSAPAGKLLL